MNDDKNVHPSIPEESFLPNVEDTVNNVEQGEDGPTCQIYQGHAYTKKEKCKRYCLLLQLLPLIQL